MAETDHQSIAGYLERRVIEMEAALAPFADLAKTWCCDERPDREVVTGAVVHAGDLERARQALKD